MTVCKKSEKVPVQTLKSNACVAVPARALKNSKWHTRCMMHVVLPQHPSNLLLHFLLLVTNQLAKKATLALTKLENAPRETSKMTSTLQNHAHQLSTNKQVLEETQRVQSKTRESIRRTQQMVADAEELGQETLDELHNQRSQLSKIETETRKLHSHQNKTASLLNKWDRWSLNLTGSSKRRAKQEAKEEMNIHYQKKESKTAALNHKLQQEESQRTQKKKISRRTKKKDVLHAVSQNTGKDKDFSQGLDSQDCETLTNIQRDDDEIDEMLDAADAALDRLDLLASNIKQETSIQSQTLEVHEKLADKSNAKQLTINGRMRRALGK